MIEIKKLIKSRLKTVLPRVYFLRASDKSTFPYLVYTIEITDLEDDVKLLTLDVDGWDKGTDTTALETLMESVHNIFKKETIITDKMVISFHSDRRLAVEDNDPALNRRKNIYLGRLYER
jgi:hypothetical protein